MCLAFLCLVAGQPAIADDAETESVARHRIDIGASFLDALSADTLNGTVGYTYNLSSKSNFNLAVPYLDPDTNTVSNSGFGDAILSFSYVPSAQISAHPWVPRTVGTGIAVLAPTGNANEGRSLDTWVIAPFVGLVLPMTDRTFIAPQVGYVHSLDKTIADTDLRLAFAEIGFGFVAINGFWTSYFPQFVRDLESDDWVINHRFAIGKMFSPKFGMSLDYSLIERFDFGSNLSAEPGYNKLIELSAHFNF